MQHIKFTFILDFIKFIKSVWATAVWCVFLLSSVGFVPKDCFISVNSWHWINHSFLAICSHISMFMLIYSVCANVSLQKIAARQQQQKSHQTEKKINHFSNGQKKGTLFKLQIEYSFCWYCIMVIFFCYSFWYKWRKKNWNFNLQAIIRVETNRNIWFVLFAFGLEFFPSIELLKRKKFLLFENHFLHQIYCHCHCHFICMRSFSMLSPFLRFKKNKSSNTHSLWRAYILNDCTDIYVFIHVWTIFHLNGRITHRVRYGQRLLDFPEFSHFLTCSICPLHPRVSFVLALVRIANAFDNKISY